MAQVKKARMSFTVDELRELVNLCNFAINAAEKYLVEEDNLSTRAIIKGYREDAKEFLDRFRESRDKNS